MAHLSHRTRPLARILAFTLIPLILLLVGLTVMPASQAEAATLSDDMIDSFTAQVHRADMEAGDYDDLTDGGTVSVYDTLRLHLNFHIPAGTLTTDNRTLTTYLKLDGDKDNWLHAKNHLFGTQIGKIMINGEEAGDYQIRILNPYYENNNSYETSSSNLPVRDDLYQYRIRIRFTFNDMFIERNRTMPITDGTLWFDMDSYWLGKDKDTPVIGFGDHTLRLNVEGMHVSLDKEALGEPVYNANTGLVEQRWKITVTNDGSMDLPAGWVLGDTMFKNDAPAILRSNAGYVQSTGFVCRLDYNNNCSTGYGTVTPPITGATSGYQASVNYTSWFFMGEAGAFTGTLHYPNTFYDNVLDYRSFTETWRMDTLNTGDTITYEYTSHSPWNAEYDHVTNRVILNPNTKYYPDILADTAQYAMPDKGAGTPYLKTSKTVGSTKTIGDCLEGANGCLNQTTWKSVFTNTGDGDQQPPWQIVDQLNRASITTRTCSPNDKYSWFRQEDIQQMIANLKDQGFDAQLDAVETCIANPGETDPVNGWHAVEDLTDLDGLYENRAVVGTKLRVNTVLKAGASVSVDYNSTSQAHGYAGERRHYNTATACTWRNNDWVCWPGSSTSSIRTIQQLVKHYGGYYGDGGSSDTGSANGKHWWLGMETDATVMPYELGSCGIRADLAPADRGKQVVFHETMTRYDSRSNGIPQGFTLAGLHNQSCIPSSNEPTCWGIKAPTITGEQVEQTVNNGKTTITIRKTGDGEWDITFHTPEQDNNYWSTIRFYVVYQNEDFNQDAWKDVNSNGRIEHSIGGNNKVHATVENGVMDLTSSNYWYHYHYDNGSITAAKSKTSHVPDGGSGTKVTYRTGFNPNAADLNPDGNTVSLTDTVAGLGDADTAVLDPGSVTVRYLNTPAPQSVRRDYGNESSWRDCTVYTISDTCQVNGYGYYYTDTSISSTPPSDALTLESNRYTAHWDADTHTLTVDGLPDKARIWVEYALVYNSVNSQLTNIRNTASLTVDGQPVQGIQTASTTNSFPIYKSAAVAKIQGVYLNKIDQAFPQTRLADARFTLMKWDGTQWVDDRDLTTGKETATVVDKLECGTAYRLVETQAPDGYELDETPYEFMLKACEAPTGLKPDGWHGVEHISMDTVTITNRQLPILLPQAGGRDLRWLPLLGLACCLTALLAIAAVSRQDDGNK